MALLLPPPPPVPRTKDQQATAYTNSSFWVDWYTKLRDIINIIQKNIEGIVTTSQANIVDGYPKLNENTRIIVGVETDDDLVITDSGRGLVLRSDAGDYFRVTVSDGGSLVVTNIGTTIPT